MTTQAHPDHRFYNRLLAFVAASWLAALLLVAGTGFLASLPMPLIPALIAATIAAPVIWYFVSPGLRAHLARIGHKSIVAIHAGRAAAALVFFWYGLQGELPPLFWILAGTGDLISGIKAMQIARQPEDKARILIFHRFGFADLLVALAIGGTYSMLADLRMAPLAELPVALIPLFLVGIYAASHILAFDMMRRAAGPLASNRGPRTSEPFGAI